MECNLSSLIPAEALAEPRYACSDFHSRDACSTHIVPSGACEWIDAGTQWQCASRRACRTPPPRRPSGTSYLFFKFHKVGGSTVSRTLQTAMSLIVGSPYVSCLEHSEANNKTAEAKARYEFCRMCTHHDSTLPLLPTFKAVLSASRETKLTMMFAEPSGAAAMDMFCPMRPSVGNVLLTGTMIRRPVDRVISKYFFLRTYVSLADEGHAHGTVPSVPNADRPCAHIDTVH